jgi:two-component system NtrC family response regulator
MYSQEERGDSGCVLVVDGAAEIRKAIGFHLTTAGYQVIEATDGVNASNVLQAGDKPLMVDAILCDVRMPMIYGVQAIEYFLRHYPAVPVVALTTYKDIELAVSLMRQGVADFLVKPVLEEELRMVVKMAVEQHRTATDRVAT